jgi:hypothetical protein
VSTHPIAWLQYTITAGGDGGGDGDGGEKVFPVTFMSATAKAINSAGTVPVRELSSKCRLVSEVSSPNSVGMLEVKSFPRAFRTFSDVSNPSSVGMLESSSL